MNRWCSLVLFSAHAILCDVLAGCSSQVEPADNAPPLRTDLVQGVTFEIDGADPLDQHLTLDKNKSYHISAAYTRPINPEVDWSDIQLLLVTSDDSEMPGGIHFMRLLGFREHETISKKTGAVTWSCRTFHGAPGKMVRFAAKPGRYEIRLCWRRDPTTVSEYSAAQEDPEEFLIPFYRCYVTLSCEE